MHARHCSPVTGRFVSTDRLLGRPQAPQSWNRYVYARNNPIRLVDTDGNAERDFTSIFVVRVNVIYSNADKRITATQTLRQVNEAGIDRARNFFAKAGIALMINRVEGSITREGRFANGTVQTPAGSMSLKTYASSNPGLNVLVSGDSIASGQTAGIGGPSAIGVRSRSDTLSDELAHALGNNIGATRNPLYNAIADFNLDASEGLVAIGSYIEGTLEETLRETASELGCVAGTPNCGAPPDAK
jgi:hypothetical protein